ncbi:hypothetical protein [Staphylococcus equorum]|uniref:hypothetical protein n=1 Tax=Staphylococcus equorum TaxID=246432 RepID=UPI003EBD1D57
MKSLHELFTELDYWENYKPVNMPSSMVKVQHVQSKERLLTVSMSISIKTLY